MSEKAGKFLLAIIRGISQYKCHLCPISPKVKYKKPIMYNRGTILFVEKDFKTITGKAVQYKKEHDEIVDMKFVGVSSKKVAKYFAPPKQGKAAKKGRKSKKADEAAESESQEG